MIIVVRTKEDAEAVSEMSRTVNLGVSLTITNLTGYAFPIFFKSGTQWKHVKPMTNMEINQ